MGKFYNDIFDNTSTIFSEVYLCFKLWIFEVEHCLIIWHFRGFKIIKNGKYLFNCYWFAAYNKTNQHKLKKLEL